jgi:hypothetical protein
VILSVSVSLSSSNSISVHHSYLFFSLSLFPLTVKKGSNIENFQSLSLFHFFICLFSFNYFIFSAFLYFLVVFRSLVFLLFTLYLSLRFSLFSTIKFLQSSSFCNQRFSISFISVFVSTHHNM